MEAMGLHLDHWTENVQGLKPGDIWDAVERRLTGYWETEDPFH